MSRSKIRFRVSGSEFKELCEKNLLEERVVLPGCKYSFTVKAEDIENPVLEIDGAANWLLKLGPGEIERLKDNSAAGDGVSFSVPTGAGENLTCMFQIDFRSRK
ncbi:MAG: hypothetical protein D6719_00945 [Candidatus Dadabacteria bacterium]|nr:MAG: hypothetical protein D6719_00945 [Candidatus Dadabacteria bacterium]